MTSPSNPLASPPRILCVDDDPACLEALRRLLTPPGFQVQCFEDAQHALREFTAFPPDVVLLDMMMPGMGGLDLAAEVNRLSQGKVPMVFLTALDCDEAVYRGYQSGAVHVLSKPADLSKLPGLLDALVRPATSTLQTPNRDQSKEGASDVPL